MGTATVNQRLAPGDFSDSGASWRGLGIYTVTGDSLSVRLTDLADGYVIADAMLLERVEGARAEVFDGPTRVADGMGKSNFGVTAIGQSLVKTFTVRNSGTADLHLTGPIALPTGFSLEANFGATTLAPGASTTFAIRYGAATAMASGEIAFDTDDAVQGRYSFNVTGATSKGGKVIDDGESGFVATGNWVFVASNYSFRDDFGYGASAGTNGSSTATWTFENLTPGQYLVAATWEPLINRATNAPYTILDGATAVGTATVNQRLAPGDFSDSGASWRGLGIYTVTGNSLSVRLTDLADGYVIADAMLLERVGNVPIAANDSYTIGHDHSLDTSPLASQFGGFTGSRRGVLDNDSTPAGRELTATLVSGPGHGTLGFNGDGTFTYTPNAGYIGVDSFTYRANDGLADSEVATATISVTENAPVAVGDRYSLRHDDTLTITAVDTGDYGPPIPSGVLLNDSDADGDLLTAVLVATVQHGTLALNANGTFTYTPNAGYTGTDTFTYQASDGLQASGVATVTLTVSDQAPTSVDDEYNVGHDRVLTVSAGAGVLANDDQAFHDLLTGTLIAGPYHGSLSFNADGSFTYTPTATFVGDDSFTYKANDGLNDSAVATATIHVMEHAPVSRSDSYTIAHDHALVVNGTGVLANDNDAERDPLTAILVATVQHGTLSLNSNGSFTYTPEAGYWGPDSFTYKANDGTLDGAITTVSIAVTVLAPIARDDLYTISHDHTLTVGGGLSGVLFNDTDPDNHPLTAVLVTSTQHGTLTLGADGSFTYIPAANYVGTDAFTYKVTNGTATSVPAIVTIQVIEQVPTPVIDGYTVGHDRTLALPADSGGVLGNDTDADGDGLSAVLVTSTQHGTLTLDASGTFTYTPATGYVGTDTFTYRPSDGLLVGDVTAVTIVVTEQAPVARSDRYSLPRDHTLDATYRGVLLNDTDADGDTLTATLVATTQHGTLAFSANGSFTYTPASGYAGTDTFSYTVSDGLQATAATTVTITVTDLPPTVQNLSYTIPPDRPLGLTADKGLLARATDPYGYQLTAALVSSPSHGTLTLNADGSFTYTPAAGFTGSDTFTYTVSDSLNASAPATVSFYVVDEPPYAGYGGDGFAVKPGETLTTTAANGVLSFASDPYGYEMTATLVTNPAHGTLTLNPDGSFTYTPAAGFTGNDSFSYTVSDGLNTSDPTSTWINVSEDAWGGDSGGGGGTEPADTKPQAGSDGYEIAPGQTLLTPIGQGVLGNDSDPGGLTLTATLVQTTQHGTLVLHADGLFSYSPDPTYVGDDHFTYQAGNGTDASQTTTVTITVTPHAPGGLLAGGVGFHGTGQTASVGYGAVTSTGNPWDSEEENNGDPDGGISDNFAPTFSGPGLEGPGQYAAEFHGTGSQAASYFGSNNVVPTQASFRGGSYGLGGYSSWGGFGWGYGWGGYYGFGYGLGYGFGGWGGYGYGYGYDYGWGWGGWGWWGNPSGSYSYDDGNGNSTTWTWSYSWGSGGWSGSESLTNTVSTDTVEGHSSSSWNWSSDGSSSSYDAQSEGSFSVDSHTSSSSAIGSDDFEQHSTSSWSSHYQSQASYNYEDGTSSHSGSSDSHYESFASYIQTHTQSTQQGSGSYTRTGQTSRTDDSNSSGSGGSDNQGHWNDTWDSTSSSTGSSVYSDDNSGERSLSAGGTETYATNQWSNDQYSRSNSDNGSTSDGITNRTTAATAKSGGERGGASSSTRKGVPFGSSYDWGQNAQYVDGTEDVTQSSGWSYHYTDRSSSGSQTSSNVTTSSSGTTHSDYGDDVSITDIRGTDLFGATTVDEWTGRNSQYDGSEKYHVHKEYSDRYNNKSSSSSTNDGQGGSTSQSHNEHTDQGEEGWSANVQGKLTFSMTATDPNTGDTIWDIGIENYVQDQAIAATFANKNSTDSSSTNGSGSYSNDSSQTSGGSDSQSRGDQISHRYGSTSENPMTGDISNLGGSGTSNLRVSYRDSYTNRRTSNATEEGSSSSSTHTDEGEGKASYVSRGTETTSTMLTDPLTGDFSSDRATRNFTENDRSTESFTNESSAATSTDSNYETDSSVSSSHTDSGSNTTNSCNQYANLTLFMLGNGQETNVDSGNSDHKETSNNEFSDETSETVTKHNAEVVSVTRSASHSDSGSDSSSFHDQWTSQLSTVSKYGLATETISDFYNRLDLFTNQHDNNSSNDEVISDGEIVSATTTTRHSDSGSNSSSSSEQGTKSSSASSSDGSSLNSSTRTFTEEKTSSGQSDNQSATETVLAHGEMVSASRSISSSDSGLSDTSHHEQTTGIVATPTFALTLNTAWDSSSSDQYDDQSQQVDSDQDGMTSSASTESHSVSKIESSSATENGSFEFSSPTDNGTENVSGVFTINEISNGTWIETSQYESNDDDGVVTGSMTTSLDQTGSDTFNQSIQGSYTFAGISAGENNHAGSGSFVQSGGTTSSFALHDLSSMTIDSTGVLSGTDVSTLDKNENWTNSRQDTVELETDGAGTDQVCLNTQDSGTLTSHEMDSMAGTTDDFQEHVSTTVLMSDTGTLSGSDSGSNFEVTTADDSSLTTVVSDPADGSDSATFSGGPMTTQSGTLTPGLAVAFQAAPLQNGMQAVFGALGITGGPPPSSFVNGSSEGSYSLSTSSAMGNPSGESSGTQSLEPEDGPSMKAAPNPGFLGGLWIDVKTWVNDLVFKDAMADKEQAKTWQDRVDAERRRNPVNIVINRLVKPAVQGVYDSATATINSLLHPITALQGVTNGVYVILTDPAGVGEAVYMKYEDFSKLSAIQQNDLVVSFAGGMIFDAVTGKYAPVAMSKALTGANTGATVVGKAFSETAKELQRGGSVYASSGIAGQGDVFYQKLVAQIREIQKGKLAEEIAAATESGRGVHAPNNVSSGLTIEPVERIGVGKVGRDFVRNAEDGLPRFEARLLDGDKTLSIGWTDNIPRTAVRLREVQQLAGGPGSFTRITGLASAEFEASVRAGTFDLGNAGEMLGKALGGKWNVRLVPRAGQQGVFDVVAELIGG